MTTLLLDLQSAITDVLQRHQRLDQRDALCQLLAASVMDVSDEEEFLAHVCGLFNAARVPA